MLRLVVIISVLVCCLGATPRLKRPRHNERIVGGSDAKIADYPYQLALEFYGSHRCGASIISANWAITTATCTDGSPINSLALRAGSDRLGSGGTVHQAAKVIIHEDYDDYYIKNDIAVIQVSTNFVLGDSVQIVALASSTPDTGVLVNITGWGATVEGGSPVYQLQALEVPVVDHFTCSFAYSVYGGISDNAMCTGVTEGGKNVCTGDGGGPVVANGELVGLASWSRGCASPEYPAINTAVASYRDWITNNTGI